MRKTLFYIKSHKSHTFLLVSFLIMIFGLSVASFTNYSNFLLFPVFALWIPVVFTSGNTLSKNERSFIRASFLFMAIFLAYWLVGYSSVVTGEVLRVIGWIMTGMIPVYALKIFSERELSFIYFVMTLAIVVLLYFFIREGEMVALIEDQNEAALVANAWYGSLYMLLSGLSLIVLMHVKSLYIRIIALVVLILTFYLNIFILQRGTNVIFTIAELGMILLMLLKRKIWVYSLSIVVLIATIYVYFSGALINIFDWLANVVPSDRLASRFNDISTALSYADMEASGGSLSGRNRLMGISWDTFTSNFGYFIFGAGEHYGSNKIIGHHSFFLDTLAQYGIIGGAIMFFYFKKQYQIIMSVLDKKTEWALFMQCAVVFLFYFLRNLYGSMSTALVNLFMLAFFPLTIQIILFYKNKTNKK